MINLPLEIPELPEGWTPLEATTVIKCLDDDGELSLVARSSAGITTWEKVGMLEAGLMMARTSVEAGFDSEEEE